MGFSHKTQHNLQRFGNKVKQTAQIGMKLKGLYDVGKVIMASETAGEIGSALLTGAALL